MRTLRLLVLIHFTCLIASAQHHQKLTPLSVCEVIENRLSLHGKMIELRGEERAGGHGSYLIPDSDCAFSLMTNGVKWRNVIFLTYPNIRLQAEFGYTDFKTDMNSIEQSLNEVKRAGYNPAKDRIITTYSGLFLTYFDLEKRVNPRIPEMHNLGFGPPGLNSPAQLLIKGKQNTTILRSK